MTTVSIATLIAFAATLAHDTESRPVEVREWCERQTSPVEVPADGLAIFADAGLLVKDGRLHYAERIGQPGGARCYGESVDVPDLGDGCDCPDSVIAAGVCEDCGGVA